MRAMSEEELPRRRSGGPESLLCLPDLALHLVCLQLQDPFDVLNLGATCRRLHQLTSSESLWTRMALSWCQGMWHCLPLPADPQPEDPKQWLLQLLRLCATRQNATRNSCRFDNGETWERIDWGRFACKVAMLSCTYKAVDERVSPFVLLRRWLYSVALYQRKNPALCFHDRNVQLSQQCVSELAALGRAREGDLRGRKQPNIDPRYYVTRVGTSAGAAWTQELFPSGPAGSICPLLACPSEPGYCAESSGTDGLVTCVSYVLGKHVERACLERHEALARMASIVRQACATLERTFSSHMPQVRARWPTCPVAHAIFSMAEEGWPDLARWQVHLDKLGLRWRDVMTECSALLGEHGALDAIVDKARIRWRHALLAEIEATFGCTNVGTVTRLNLTDCDVIGGDNTRQEMAAAAFVSPSAVLVTWQLLGRGSY